MNLWFFCFWLLLTGTLFSSTHSSAGAWNQDVPLTFTQTNKWLFRTKMSNKKSESLICQNVPHYTLQIFSSFTLVITHLSLSYKPWWITDNVSTHWKFVDLDLEEANKMNNLLAPHHPSNQQLLKEEGFNFSARIWTCGSRESEHFKPSGRLKITKLSALCVRVCVCTYMRVGEGQVVLRKRIKSTFNVKVSHPFAYTLEGRIRILSLQTWHKLPQRRSLLPLHFVSLSAPFPSSLFSRTASFPLFTCNRPAVLS